MIASRSMSATPKAEMIAARTLNGHGPPRHSSWIAKDRKCRCFSPQREPDRGTLRYRSGRAEEHERISITICHSDPSQGWFDRTACSPLSPWFYQSRDSTEWRPINWAPLPAGDGPWPEQTRCSCQGPRCARGAGIGSLRERHGRAAPWCDVLRRSSAPCRPVNSTDRRT